MYNAVQLMWFVDRLSSRVLASGHFENGCSRRVSALMVIVLNDIIFHVFTIAYIDPNQFYSEAALRPAAGSMIPEIFKPSIRGTANGIFSWGIYWGYGLTFVLGNYLAPLDLFE